MSAAWRRHGVTSTQRRLAASTGGEPLIPQTLSTARLAVCRLEPDPCEGAAPRPRKSHLSLAASHSRPSTGQPSGGRAVAQAADSRVPAQYAKMAPLNPGRGWEVLICELVVFSDLSSGQQCIGQTQTTLVTESHRVKYLTAFELEGSAVLIRRETKSVLPYPRDM